jgi:hypothetical protein
LKYLLVLLALFSCTKKEEKKYSPHTVYVMDKEIFKVGKSDNPACNAIALKLVSDMQSKLNDAIEECVATATALEAGESRETRIKYCMESTPMRELFSEAEKATQQVMTSSQVSCRWIQ